MAAVAAALAAGCGASVPESAHEILDILEDADVASCDDRREPVPDIVTCEDADGDLTVGIVDDGLTSARSTAGSSPGPWVVGDTFVVITYDLDVDRAQRIVETLGAGELYTVEDGEPVPIDD